MKMFLIILLLSMVSIGSKSQKFNYHLIKDYVQWNNIRAVSFVTCTNFGSIPLDAIESSFQNSEIWINYWDMSNKQNLSSYNYQDIFVRLSYPIYMVVDLECTEISDFFYEISKRFMFHYERYWLIFGRSAEQVFDVLRVENINVDAEVTTVVPIDETKYQIYDTYSPSHLRSGQLKVENVGTWSQENGLEMTVSRSKMERRRDFGGITFLSVITIPTLPKNKNFEEHLNSDEELHLDNMSKNNYRVFQLFMDMFNFKMLMYRAKVWGIRGPDGYWSGAIGLINRSEVDISVSGIRWENSRYEAFDQTTNSFYCQLAFIFRHPKSVDSMNVFFTPFDTVVWFSIFLVGVFISLAMKYIFSLEDNFTKSLDEVDRSYSNSFLMVFGIVLQQGYGGKVTFTSSRVLTTSTLIFSILIYQFYGSFIMGSLLMESPKTINTIKALLNSRLEVKMDEYPYVQDTFSHNRDEYVMQLYDKVMSQPSPFMPMLEGLKLVKDGGFAFHTDGSSAYPLLKTLVTDNEARDLQEVHYIAKLPTGPGVPRKSPLREVIKIGIRRIYETGHLAHIWKTWIGKLPKIEISEVEMVSVDLVHFSSAFYALILGMQISIAAFIVEIILVYRYKFRTFSGE